MSTDRTTKVSPGAYDQVIALTQSMINAGLENLWLAKTPDPPVPATVTARGIGSLKHVTLQAPRVIVSTTPGAFSQVVYVMGFNSGTLEVFKNADGDDMTDYDMTGWRFAFAIDLGLSKLAPGSPEYSKIRAKINQPGNYTITQLLLDISTAGISEFRSDLSSFGTRDWSKESADVKENFGNLVRKQLNNIFTQGLNNVGYAVAADNPGTAGDHPPTFLPTDVRFQTYPWVGKAPGFQPTSGLTGTSVLNYLCYLEMTDKRAPPTGPAQFLTPNGNWTDGDGSKISSTDLGTFCMSRRNFLERWLLPKLRVMNQAMEPSVTKIPVSCHVDGLWLNWSCSTDMQLGRNSAYPNISDPYFDWKETAPYTVTADIPGVIQKGTYNCYQFTSTFQAPNTNDLAGASGALCKVWGSASSNCTNRLLYKEGSSQITLLGNANTEVYFSMWAPLWQLGGSRDDRLKYHFNWSITFNLESVRDGGLQITAKTGDAKSDKEASIEQGLCNQFATYFDKAFPAAISRFNSFEKDLVAGLAGQQKFYFPASGTFFFKNPVLNFQGDLICSVGYNGTDNDIPGAPPRSLAENKPAQALPPTPAGLIDKSKQKD